MNADVAPALDTYPLIHFALNRMDALLSFRKQAEKPPVFTFRRSDGSVTGCALRNLPVAHDLAHYAVEQTLRLRRGFYGLLDAGFAPDDFEAPRAHRPAALLPANLPTDAHQAEHIVGLLQTEWLCGPNDTFLDDLRQSLTARNVPFPPALTNDTLADIRSTYAALLHDWSQLPVGESLHLSLRIG